MRALLEGLRWRSIGPYRGGRVVAVAGHPSSRLTFFFGSTGGGVWRTDDAGVTWVNVSDGFFRRASVGALAVTVADPDVLYVGMGEASMRNTVCHGDGVYRSADGGSRWEHRGLDDTRHIARVRVDPRDPGRVYVAAVGHGSRAGGERGGGVFRSSDAGATWERVLVGAGGAGAADLVIDPHDPRRLFASTWRVRRTPWSIESGGEGSGLWRSEDGGGTWTELTRRADLPAGVVGRIGLSVSPVRPGRVYAIVEAVDGGVMRSDDGGDTWVRLSTQREVRGRAFYYSAIVADPGDAEAVWALNVFAWRSMDGGATFQKHPVQHGDCHDLWIDPSDPRRLILGDDGGAAVSLDGGWSWSSLFTQPTAELYRITTDTRVPYRVHGTQQDNTSVSLPTWSPLGALGYQEAREVGGGESGGVAVRPDDPDVVYAGNIQGFLTRLDQGTGQRRTIAAQPDVGAVAADLEHRFNWTSPLVLSAHDPEVLYHGAEAVLRTTDEGHTWVALSPDLTRADPERMRGGGGPISAETAGGEHYGTLSALAESPRSAGVLWAGSDDGLVHVSADAGATWRRVTPPGVPEWARIRCIEACPHDQRSAYVSADAHLLGDDSPHLWRTGDVGESWVRIDEGLPAAEVCRVVRADPRVPGLLAVGTDTGVWLSSDEGRTWSAAQGNLPVVPVEDLRFHGDDLVAGTHGRGAWILGDLPAVRRAARSGVHDRRGRVVLHAPRPYDRYPLHKHELQEAGGRGQRVSGFWVTPFRRLPDGDSGDPAATRIEYLTAGENHVQGVTVLYELEDPGDDDLHIVICDAAGSVLRRHVAAAHPAGEAAPSGPVPTRRAGLNRFIWDTRPEPGVALDEAPSEDDDGTNPAPEVLPGVYTVRVELGSDAAEAAVEIRHDPRSRASQADLVAQHALAMRLFEMLNRHHAAVNELRSMRHRLESVDSLASLRDELRGVEDRLVSDEFGVPARVALDVRIAGLLRRLSWILPPTAAATQVADRLEAELDAALSRVDDIASRAAERPAPVQEATAS